MKVAYVSNWYLKAIMACYAKTSTSLHTSFCSRNLEGKVSLKREIFVLKLCCCVHLIIMSVIYDSLKAVLKVAQDMHVIVCIICWHKINQPVHRLL